MNTNSDQAAPNTRKRKKRNWRFRPAFWNKMLKVKYFTLVACLSAVVAIVLYGTSGGGGLVFGLLGALLYAWAIMTARSLTQRLSSEPGRSLFKIVFLSMVDGPRALVNKAHKSAEFLEGRIIYLPKGEICGHFIFTEIFYCIYAATIYVSVLCYVDYYYPETIKYWYDLSRPFVEFQLSHSFMYESVYVRLWDYGAQTRADFIFHAYAACLYITIGYTFVRLPQIIRAIKFSNRLEIFWLVKSSGVRERYANPDHFFVKSALPRLLAGILAVVIVILLFGFGQAYVTEEHSISRYHITLSPHKHRIEMLWYAMLVPLGSYYFIFNSVSLFNAHIYMWFRMRRFARRGSH